MSDTDTTGWVTVEPRAADDWQPLDPHTMDRTDLIEQRDVARDLAAKLEAECAERERAMREARDYVRVLHLNAELRYVASDNFLKILADPS